MGGIPYDVKLLRNESSVMEEIGSNFSEEISDRIVKIAKGADGGVLIILMALVEVILYKYQNKTRVDILVPELKQKTDTDTRRLLEVSVHIAPEERLKGLLQETQSSLAASLKALHTVSETQRLTDAANASGEGGVVVVFGPFHGLQNYDSIKRDTVFFFEKNSTSLRLRIGYKEASYKRKTITTLMDRFFRLTDLLVTDPERSVDSVAFPPVSCSRTKVGIRSVRRKFENETVSSRSDGHMSRLREAVRPYPDVERIAKGLRQVGLKDRARIGLMMKQEKECLIGIVSVLKAGGVAVPD